MKLKKLSSGYLIENDELDFESFKDMKSLFSWWKRTMGTTNELEFALGSMVKYSHDVAEFGVFAGIFICSYSDKKGKQDEPIWYN